MDVEIFSIEVLKKINKKKLQPHHKEHVTTFIRESNNFHFMITATTPQLHFSAQVVHLTQKEIFLSTTEKLLTGEEVKLNFRLPDQAEIIECRALVRSSKASDPPQSNLSLRFLDLRPSQIEKINIFIQTFIEVSKTQL